jgi:hypothetical protein
VRAHAASGEHEQAVTAWLDEIVGR